MADGRDDFYQGTFPDGFTWSCATASYQIEGAWNTDGKGRSIWDTFSHTDGKVCNGDTGDVACDSYHNYEKDVQLLKDLGVTHYRFSISWPRILPDGTIKSLNAAGVAYYDRLLDALGAAGVQPVVTLYHWDLPQALQDIGGWTNPELTDLFAEYARVCYRSFGARVKMWITFNEPSVFTWLGYGNAEHAPGIKDPTDTPFQVAHTVIRAHAKAYHVYADEFKPEQKGQCGITINMDWCEPKDPTNPDDEEASRKLIEFKLGWWANPIYGNGDYPGILKAQLEKKSKELGMSESPLKPFTAEEVKNNKGTWDFFGLNHYTTRLVSKLSEPVPPTTQASLMDVEEHIDDSWTRAESEWLYVVPWGLRRLLSLIKDEYGNPPIYITENGFSDTGDDIQDKKRINYYRTYINEVLKSVCLDKVDVRGYTAWSLMDNFEWAQGFRERFGLHHVDFSSAERTRTPKASARFYAKVVKDNGFPKSS